MPPDTALRRRLALALDIDDLDLARRWMRAVSEHVAIAKVGLELFSATGPGAIAALRGDGFEVIADLKLHDIPTTVGRAARALARHGVGFVTVHTQGGADMLAAAREGFAAGADDAGVAMPVGLGVTVLTSDPDADEATLRRRVDLAVSSGLGGVVCAAPDLPVVRAASNGLVTLVPGTRPPGAALNDQARVATPREAFAAGADVLVVGRAVTAADDLGRAMAEFASAC